MVGGSLDGCYCCWSQGKQPRTLRVQSQKEAIFFGAIHHGAGDSNRNATRGILCEEAVHAFGVCDNVSRCQIRAFVDLVSAEGCGERVNGQKGAVTGWADKEQGFAGFAGADEGFLEGGGDQVEAFCL